MYVFLDFALGALVKTKVPENTGFGLRPGPSRPSDPPVFLTPPYKILYKLRVMTYIVWHSALTGHRITPVAHYSH